MRHAFGPVVALLSACLLIPVAIGPGGLWPEAFAEHAALKIVAYLILMTHVTITAMSLCFHRMHTHRGVQLHPVIDQLMQVWLWTTTSMCKRDWVAVHIYHHAHSDTVLDPHSPVQKGFARIFFLGVLDYAAARHDPEVIRLKKNIPENRLEAFMNRNNLLGVILSASLLLLVFGPAYGLLLTLITFLISPLFAVGGVNALAHHWGYRNHPTRDNSRNIGFLLPLNWMICGELDHNNHHAHPRSCSFRHRWYELDIGYVYLRALSALGWAELKHVYRGSPSHVRDLIQTEGGAPQARSSA